MGNIKSILSAPDQTRVTVPVGYEVPSFPSLYPPRVQGRNAVYLYYSEDMYRFIVFWTLIIVGMVHICSGLVAAVVFFRKHPFIAVSIPFVAAAVGLLLAFISGSIVGVALAAIYNAAHFNMATWVPFIWGAVQGLVLVLGSYNAISTLI